MAMQETVLNGRYRLLAQQGSGGMAVVYKAQDLQLGRIVAIKILRPSLTSDPAFLTRFKQEARNVANLSHPNIVTLHDFGQDGNTYYMVMEFIDGTDLKKLIRSSAPFSTDRALHIGIQICAGVGYAHRAGLVHADVKPQNILLTTGDSVKVTDFGIAQALSQTQNQERQSVVWGSPHYFAPEQATGEPPNTASDVYAIGIVLFEMLTGKLPYSGADQQELALAHIRDQVPHITDINPALSVHLDRIIYKVMSKDAAGRYRTADQLGRILISYRNEQSGYTQQQPQQPQSPASAPPNYAQNYAPNYAPNAPSPLAGAPQPPSLRPQGNNPSPQVIQQQPQPPVAPQPVQQNNAYNPQPFAPSLSSAPRPLTNAPVPPPQQGLATPLTNTVQPGMPAQNAPPRAANYQTPSQGYPPQDPYFGDSSGLRPAPTYPTSPRGGVDVVSIILGVIAFGAVIGLVVLWLMVYAAYFPAPR